MTTLKFFTATLLLISAQANAAINTKSQIKDYNYVCTHTTKPEALVFKTTTPQKIWRTGLNEKGEIKKNKAFELTKIKINTASLKNEGDVASFKANLAKDYELKGVFVKETDGEIPLTTISSYIPDGKQSQIKDKYNCTTEQKETKLILGLAE